jgi:glycosyltransferase involved in cell wall biosynthesis
VSSSTSHESGSCGSLRVLVISPDPRQKAGGVERFCSILRDALRLVGHDVRIAGPARRSGPWAARFGLSPLIESASVPNRLDGWIPDAVITNGLLGGLRRRGVPTVHVFHGTMVGNVLKVGAREPLRQRLRAAVGGGLAEVAAARGAVNIAVSESAAREARRFYGVSVSTVIPNGIDMSLFRSRLCSGVRREFGFASAERLALFVGRAEPRKAPEVALESCQRAGFKLVVAGPKPIPGALNLGAVEPERLAALYSACDCVVFPTRYEACSYVVLEALASGVPLVTTPVGWMKTFLRHVPEYGVLVAGPHPNDIAAILGRLEDPSVAVAVEAGGAWVREHNSLEVFSAQWRALLDSVVSGELSASDGTPSLRTVRDVP